MITFILQKLLINQLFSVYRFMSDVFTCPRISANLKSVYQILLYILCDCFIIKQSPKLNKSVPKIFTRNNHFLLSSIIELRKKKIRCFQKLPNKFFYNIVIINYIKGWKAQVYAQCYVSLFPCPFSIFKKHTYTSLVQLNNYQIQILKKEKRERALAYTPPYSIKITANWPSNQNFEKGKVQKVFSFPVSPLRCISF